MRQKFVIIDHFLPGLQWCVFHSRENIPHNPQKCNPPIGSLSRSPRPAAHLGPANPGRSDYFHGRNLYFSGRDHSCHGRKDYFDGRNDFPADANIIFTDAAFTSTDGAFTFMDGTIPTVDGTIPFMDGTIISADANIIFMDAAFTRTVGRTFSPIYRQFYTSLVPPSCPARVRDYHLSPKKNLKKVR